MREGSFVDPEYGDVYNAGGSGSGFVIDLSGIAVTNNHVVTGATFLQVCVDGEVEPRNARILGVSECSDLAVIDIDGTGFPCLECSDGPIEVGTKIYVAGFPDGDPEYALVEGIVSKAKSDADTYWASVDSAIEHDRTEYEYADPLSTGTYDLWTDCGGDAANSTIALEGRPGSGPTS